MRTHRPAAVLTCLFAAIACGRARPVPVSRDEPDGTAVVVRIVDGDTLIARTRGRDVRVRLIGVDAPETWSRRDCFGADAARALGRLAPPGSTLRTRGDAEPYDRYRRRLLYLWTARGGFVNATLIRTGFARAMFVPPDTRYAGVFRAAEREARRAGTGLWTACPERRVWPSVA